MRFSSADPIVRKHERSSGRPPAAPEADSPSQDAAHHRVVVPGVAGAPHDFAASPTAPTRAVEFERPRDHVGLQISGSGSRAASRPSSGARGFAYACAPRPRAPGEHGPAEAGSRRPRDGTAVCDSASLAGARAPALRPSPPSRSCASRLRRSLRLLFLGLLASPSSKAAGRAWAAPAGLRRLLAGGLWPSASGSTALGFGGFGLWACGRAGRRATGAAAGAAPSKDAWPGSRATRRRASVQGQRRERRDSSRDAAPMTRVARSAARSRKRRSSSRRRPSSKGS